MSQADKFSTVEVQKRKIKDMNAELLHKNLLVGHLREEIDQLKAEKAGFQQKIESQIETLKSASQSVSAYTERERNILQSQVDDLEGILRGEL